MAMKKAELEAHSEQYASLMKDVRAAEGQGFFELAMKLAEEALEHVDAMMRYEERWNEREFQTVEAVEILLQYAPLLLDGPRLERVGELLKQSRRVEKNTSESLASKLDTARTQLWLCHRLWDALERNSGLSQAGLTRQCDIQQQKIGQILDRWEKMGLLVRTSREGDVGLELRTRLGCVIQARCHECGEITSGPKAAFLQRLECPECGMQSAFALLDESSSRVTPTV
jgi:hypothetical protein